MMVQRRGRRPRNEVRLDLGLAAAALCVAALLVIGTHGLPPPRFEPMGSAALPRILAGLITLFAAIVAWNAWRDRPVGRGAASDTDGSRRSPLVLRPLGVPACLVAYVGALDFLRAPFVPTTVVLVVALGVLLSRPGWRTALAFAGFGLFIALLIDTVFTRFLYVDLG